MAIIVVNSPQPLTRRSWRPWSGWMACCAPTLRRSCRVRAFGFLDAPGQGGVVAPDDRTMMLFVTITAFPPAESFNEAVGWIREQAATAIAETALEVAVTGPAGITTDIVHAFDEVDLRVTLTTVALVLVILLLIYRSPLLAILRCSVWAGHCSSPSRWRRCWRMSLVSPSMHRRQQ